MRIVTNLPETGQLLAWDIKRLLEALAISWAGTMRRVPVPPLYKSGIRYQREPNEGTGLEEWADPWTVAKRGWGDCDDLIGYRVAELRVAGEPATVQVCRKRGTKRFHVRVRRADGRVEDPSIILGGLRK